jgi:hypothetical protein
LKGKKIISLLVFVISILVFELISSKLSEYILNLKRLSLSPYRATLIGMAVVLFILFPGYKWLDEAVQRFAKRFLLAGKKTWLGILFAFFLSFGILYLLYLKMWFGVAYSSALKHLALIFLQLFN